MASKTTTTADSYNNFLFICSIEMSLVDSSLFNSSYIWLSSKPIFAASALVFP